jgi:hypothetical protein
MNKTTIIKLAPGELTSNKLYKVIKYFEYIERFDLYKYSDRIHMSLRGWLIEHKNTDNPTNYIILDPSTKMILKRGNLNKVKVVYHLVTLDAIYESLSMPQPTPVVWDITLDDKIVSSLWDKKNTEIHPFLRQNAPIYFYKNLEVKIKNKGDEMFKPDSIVTEIKVIGIPVELVGEIADEIAGACGLDYKQVEGVSYLFYKLETPLKVTNVLIVELLMERIQGKKWSEVSNSAIYKVADKLGLIDTITFQNPRKSIKDMIT